MGKQDKHCNQRSNRRKDKRSRGEKKEIKPKFQEERQQKIQNAPLKPMNDLQKQYIRMVREKSIILATGYAGTSKTYIPTVIACDEYLAGNIDNIYLVRPAVSNSKSLGYFGGDLVEKMSNWLGPVLSIMKERLGQGMLEVAIKTGDIQMIPLETIKGHSFKRCFVICDESEDLTQEECKKFVTRLGEGCTAVMAGDVRQSELKDRNGMNTLIEMLRTNPQLEESTGHVDFDRPSDIVRSEQCKQWIMAFEREGK